MYLMYTDEAGDPGHFTGNNIPIFLLNGLVVHETKWRAFLEFMVAYRRRMKRLFRFKMRDEMHVAKMIRGDGEYKLIPMPDRVTMLRIFAHELASQSYMNILSVIIDKSKHKDPTYSIFENAWRALIQRFENTAQHRNFNPRQPTIDHGIVVPDDTSTKQLRTLVRKMRRFNNIPSQPQYQTTYRNLPLVNVIEDAFFRESRDSLFVQAADAVTYMLYQQEVPNSSSRRHGVRNFFKVLDPVLCKVACVGDPQGIVRL